MGQLTSFLQLFMSPIGMAFVAMCGALYLYGMQAKLGRWLILGALIFAASLSRFVNEWVTNPPPFSGPIDTLVGAGRPLTFLLLLLSLTMVANKSRGGRIPAAMVGLVCCHLVIGLKTFMQGSIDFALLVITIEFLILGLFWRISSSWLTNETAIEYAILAIFFAAFLFVVVNLVQFSITSSPQFVANGQFNGTTGNPQHAAALMGCAIPASLYVLLGYAQKSFRLLALVTLVLVMYFLSLTGSRTGLMLAALSVLLIARRQGGLAILVTSGLAVLGSVFFLTNDFALEKFLDFQDTRSEVWAAMWRQFLSNPILGSQLVTDRLGFGENSWLAMGAATGLVGLIPLGVFGLLSLSMSLKLITKRSRTRKIKLQCDVLGATILCLLAGSIFEAYLLSPLSAPCLIACVAVVAGNALLVSRTKQKKPLHHSRQSRFVRRAI